MKSESDLKEKLHEDKPQESQNSTSFSQKDLKFKKDYLEQEKYLNGSSIFSTLFFKWISTLISFGNKFEIRENAIPTLKNSHKPKIQFDRLCHTFETQEKSKRLGMNLVRSVGKTYKKQLFVICFCGFIFTCVQMYQPILMNQIMNYAKQQDKALGKGAIFFFAIFLTSFVISVAASHLFFHFAVFGYNLSNTLSLMIYNKALKHPLITEKQYSISDIINYSQVDAQRMTYMGFQLTAILFTPAFIITGLLLLYFYIGISFLVGTGVTIVMMIFTLIFMKLAAKANDQLLKAKDQRMKVTEQILQIIKFIKTNAQEKYFFQKLHKKREEELKHNKRVLIMNVFTMVSYWLSSPLIISITFTVYLALGNELTAPKAFTTIILFQILSFPMRLFPTAIAQLIQMWSSVKRIQKFLCANQVKSDFLSIQSEEYDKNDAITIENGTYLWGAQIQKEEKEKKENEKRKQKEKDSRNELIDEEDLHKQSLISQNSDNQSSQKIEKPKFIKALKNINIKFPKNTITMIVGDIGSGKSSLLYAILNEMTVEPSSKSRININGSIAFCSQKPWIMSGTVKDNILFFLPHDEEKFKDAIYFSGLQDDLKILGNGINTEIGEKGVNLSGGQKVRVSLARAIYSNRDIYLLDDILSAVDVHVGKFLMQKTILGYLKNKTVIMPSHAIHFALQTDNIVIMKKGEIVKSGNFKEIENSEEFQQVYKLQKQKDSEKKESQDEQKIKKELSAIKNAVELLEKNKEKQKKQQNANNKVIEELVMPEDHKRGQISLQTFKYYVHGNGGAFFVFIIIFAMSGWAALSTLSNIEIEHWCQNPDDSAHSHLMVYMALAISAIAFMAIRIYTLVMSGIKLGRAVHKKMIKSLLYASITDFYNRVPLGRLLNRLSKDLRQVDETIGYSVGNLLVSIFSLLGNLTICLYASTLYVLIPIFFVSFICFKFQRYYMKTQRECVRLQNTTTSPIVSGFTSAVNGVGTIRAYSLQSQFLNSQVEKVDINKRMRVTREALSAWFSMRLTMLTFFINMTAIGYAILADAENASLLGLLLTYAMSMNDDIISTITSYATLQTKMISIERVYNFTQIIPEVGYSQYCKKWRTKEEGYEKMVFPKGQIQFQNFSAKYRKDLPLVLKNINFKIQEGEKVGIVGRTGAGKSTLVNCLLRIVEPAEGKVLFDGKNILQYRLKDLRANLTLIDQQPTLIKGSFRENLDPSHRYSEEQLQQIIEECNLKEVVESKGGLDALVTNQSLSVGEKQLLCICRAFLKKSKIVLIDEATANIDNKNDKLIQDVIANKFTNSTVLTIAHRLSTLKNSDKILVLGKGEVLEWGSPKNLLERENGIYKQMCEANDSSYLE